MHITAHRLELSPELSTVILRNWFGTAVQLGSGAGQRIKACQTAAKVIACGVQKQLTACGLANVSDWSKHRPLLIGYVNGLSDAVARGHGEASRWATTLVSLNALRVLLGSEWHEETVCGEAQKLWLKRPPNYLAGVEAAEIDYATLRKGKTPVGLASRLIHEEMRGK